MAIPNESDLHRSVDVTKPATDAFSITPNDSTGLSTIARGIYFGADGDVKID
jgi:hypothetical protein